MNRLAIGSSDKTAYLLQCMQEDFADGLLLIDPTGAIAEAAADRIPVDLTERAFYLDPADLGHPPGFNVLDGVLEDDRYTVASDIRTFFDLITPEGRGTLTRARSNYLLQHALRLLLDVPGATLLLVPKLLIDEFYRTQCLLRSTDRATTTFWQDEFDGWQDADRQSATLDIQTKFAELLGSPLLRNIVGQPHSTFSLTGGHIVLANLDRARLGDRAAFLLGSLLTSRATGPIYIADAAFFASDHLASLLPQDRFTLACRFLEELPETFQQAVLAIPDKTIFKTNRADAERLAFEVGVLNPSVLVDLGPTEARNSHGPLAIAAPPSKSRLEAIRRRSRACYTRPRQFVERMLRR